MACCKASGSMERLCGQPGQPNYPGNPSPSKARKRADPMSEMVPVVVAQGNESLPRDLSGLPRGSRHLIIKESMLQDHIYHFLGSKALKKKVFGPSGLCCTTVLGLYSGLCDHAGCSTGTRRREPTEATASSDSPKAPSSCVVFTQDPKVS